MFEPIANLISRIEPRIIEATLELAVEIAREGREGRHIGTLFTIGDEETVLQHSRLLILDPLAGHSETERYIENHGLRGTIKELAQLDGAFIFSAKGIALSACRYIDAPVANIDIPLGLGSRHLAGASISKATKALAIVVSESSMVRIFEDGALVAEIIPELWLLNRHIVNLPPPYGQHNIKDLSVITRIKKAS